MECHGADAITHSRLEESRKCVGWHRVTNAVRMEAVLETQVQPPQFTVDTQSPTKCDLLRVPGLIGYEATLARPQLCQETKRNEGHQAILSKTNTPRGIISTSSKLVGHWSETYSLFLRVSFLKDLAIGNKSLLRGCQFKLQNGSLGWFLGRLL